MDITAATPPLDSLRRAYRAGQNASSGDTPDSDDPARDAWVKYLSRPRKTPLTAQHESAFMQGWVNFDDDNEEITARYHPDAD